MMMIKVTILLALFAFGIVTPVESNSVKSVETAANRLTTMKMDENKVLLHEKKGDGKNLPESFQKDDVQFQSGAPSKDPGAIMDNAKWNMNFLKVLEEKKRPLLKELLNEVICPFKFSQLAWRENILSFPEWIETKSFHFDFHPSVLKITPDGNKYFDENRIQSIFKLLQPRKEEILKEVFWGICISFFPMNRRMVLEMNVTSSSSSEKEGGLPLLHNKPRGSKP